MMRLLQQSHLTMWSQRVIGDQYVGFPRPEPLVMSNKLLQLCVHNDPDVASWGNVQLPLMVSLKTVLYQCSITLLCCWPRNGLFKRKKEGDRYCLFFFVPTLTTLQHCCHQMDGYVGNGRYLVLTMLVAWNINCSCDNLTLSKSVPAFIKNILRLNVFNSTDITWGK